MNGSEACIQNRIPAQYKDIRLVKGNLEKEELIKTVSTYNADILKFKTLLALYLNCHKSIICSFVIPSVWPSI